MAKNEGDTAICFPGEEHWELWRLKSGRFELADTMEPLRPFKSASHYAFPVHSAFGVPIWAGTDDPDMLDDLVDMQLEKQGLKPEPGPGVVLDYRKTVSVEMQAQSPKLDQSAALDFGKTTSLDAAPAAEAEAETGPTTRNLILATVLNPNYEHPLPRSGSDQFDVSPRFLVLPGNHIVIWKELGRLVMALTRGGQLVYFQGLSSGDLDAATVHEVRCVLLGLQGQGVVAEPSGIHLWVEDVDDGAGAMLQEELGLDAIVTLRPDPVLPATDPVLVPTEVAVSRIEKRRAAKMRNIFLACAACYLALVGWYLFDYFKVLKEEERLAARAEELRPQAEWMRPFKNRWLSVEPVIDKSLYPAQVVHHLAGILPERVNITSFTAENGQITILGESSNTTIGRLVLPNLQKEKGLSDYNWRWVTRPAVDSRRKDNTASFRIVGEYKYDWGGVAPQT